MSKRSVISNSYENSRNSELISNLIAANALQIKNTADSVGKEKPSMNQSPLKQALASRQSKSYAAKRQQRLNKKLIPRLSMQLSSSSDHHSISDIDVQTPEVESCPKPVAIPKNHPEHEIFSQSFVQETQEKDDSRYHDTEDSILNPEKFSEIRYMSPEKSIEESHLSPPKSFSRSSRSSSPTMNQSPNTERILHLESKLQLQFDKYTILENHYAELITKQTMMEGIYEDTVKKLSREIAELKEGHKQSVVPEFTESLMNSMLTELYEVKTRLSTIEERAKGFLSSICK